MRVSTKMSQSKVFASEDSVRKLVCNFSNTRQTHFETAAHESSYHAGAVAEVAVLDFGAWLVALAIAALTGCFYVDGYLFVDSLRRLSERQLHDVLCRKNRVTRYALKSQIKGTLWLCFTFPLTSCG